MPVNTFSLGVRVIANDETLGISGVLTRMPDARRPDAPKKLTRPNLDAWQPAAGTADAGGMLDQLSARIRSEGGVWDGKRALAACQDLGFYCTIQRARTILGHVAEQNPELLTAVRGKRWTYDATEES